MKHPTPKPFMLQNVYDMAKLDFEALKRDILIKYHQNMPHSASDYWRTWLENVKREIAAVPDHYVWPVDTLKTAGKTTPPPLAGQIPNDLLELREREIQPAQEVST